MSLLKMVAFSLILVSLVAKAGEDQCGVTKNVNQLILCAESRSPEVLKAELNLTAKKAGVGQASQLLNPELASEYVSGQSAGKTQSELDVSLAFPIEVGGGRAARKSFAEFEVKKAEAELQKVRGEVRKQVILNFVRFYQINEELKMIDESLSAFSKLVQQYSQRPKLSPEQEVTLTVFDTARSDYTFKKQDLQEEATKIESFFKVTSGKTLTEFQLSSVGGIKNWPEVLEKSEATGKSPLLAIYEAEIGSSKAEVEKARSDVFPSLSVGPSVKRVSDGDQTNNQVGINLSMPLPILSINSGGRSLAATNLKTAEMRRNFAIQEIRAMRTALVRQYSSSVKLLKSSAISGNKESKHKKIESYFYRGMVPSALVIEAHRSLVEFEKTRNERELKALESYLDIRFLDGDSVEFNI